MRRIVRQAEQDVVQPDPRLSVLDGAGNGDYIADALDREAPSAGMGDLAASNREGT